MNRSNDLLNLEKKLEAHNINDRVLNKFVLKPDINRPSNNNELIGNLNSFLSNFKKSNEELLSNPAKLSEMNIEDEANNKFSKKGIIKMVNIIITIYFNK